VPASLRGCPFVAILVTRPQLYMRSKAACNDVGLCAHYSRMNAYSGPKKKIVNIVERGMPKIEAAKTFGVGLSSVKRYVTSYRDGDRA
jgi:hypothetical protein